MYGMPSRRAAALRRRAIIKTCDSLSITQGPAIRNRGCDCPSSRLPMRTARFIRGLTLGRLKADAKHLARGLGALLNQLACREPRFIGRRLPFSAMGQRRSDKGLEQRMGLQRTRLELRMELAAKEPGMIANLDDFHVRAVRGFRGDFEPVGHQR